MSATLNEKKRAYWIALAALFAVVIPLGLLGFKVAAGVLLILIGFPIFIGLQNLANRAETAEEAEARAATHGQGDEKTARLEDDLAGAEDDAQRSRVEADLLWKYLRTWQKSSTLIPNSLVEGFWSSPAELEDGDLEVLAKLRNLQASMVEKDPTRHKGLAKEVRKTDESVVNWRRAAEEVRDGIREAPEHFDAEDYLAQLNAAFPPPEQSQAADLSERTAEEVNKAR